MRKVVSAGGLVVYNDQLLMLKKNNGEWVLPKGRQEINEALVSTALREVKEETNIDAKATAYLGVSHYEFSNYWTEYELISKSVHWYKMIALSFELIPLEDEGFQEARFLSYADSIKIAKYDDERAIIRRMIDQIIE
jgi:8-oxo-dGTP pyrophosphatase MutT (NUDIX family)